MSANEKCKAVDCPVDKSICRRYTSPISRMRQIWIKPQIKDGKCEDFVVDAAAKAKRS